MRKLLARESGLSDVKKLVASAPVVLREGLRSGEARELTRPGAVVEVR